MDQDFFKRGISEIIELESLKKKLSSGIKLRIKMGVDPTKPDLHLGHAVGMKKLKKLQDLGHKIVFIIGDYTTKIGDPSGRNTTRPVLSDSEIAENAKTYFEQAGIILDMKKTEVRYNSEWFKKMNFNDVLQLAGKFTVAQLIERDDFSKRLKAGHEVSLHELLYPVMQAYDSVAVKSDVEIGGTDQKFNILAGRSLQKKMGQKEQDIVLIDLLVGTDGTEKMSKSLGNYIGITEKAEVQFGKVMSIPDNLIFMYFELCTDIDDEKIKEYKEDIDNGKNPKKIKEILAQSIVEIYHGKEDAEKAREQFDKVFSKREMPEKAETFIIGREENIIEVLDRLNVFSSKSEARRKIQEGAIKINGVKISEPTTKVEEGILQVGKHKFYEIKWKR